MFPGSCNSSKPLGCLARTSACKTILRRCCFILVSVIPRDKLPPSFCSPPSASYHSPPQPLVSAIPCPSAPPPTFYILCFIRLLLLSVSSPASLPSTAARKLPKLSCDSNSIKTRSTENIQEKPEVLLLLVWSSALSSLREASTRSS